MFTYWLKTPCSHRGLRVYMCVYGKWVCEGVTSASVYGSRETLLRNKPWASVNTTPYVPWQSPLITWREASSSKRGRRQDGSGDRRRRVGEGVRDLGQTGRGGYTRRGEEEGEDRQRGSLALAQGYHWQKSSHLPAASPRQQHSARRMPSLCSYCQLPVCTRLKVAPRAQRTC